MKTSKQRLEDGFDTLADVLFAAIKTEGCGAATLNVARQFLKDNNITARPAQGSPIGNLAAALPFAGDDNADSDADLPN